MDIWHALVSGILIAALYYGLHGLGVLEGKTKGQRALILGPAVFVVMLIFNLIWPA